MRYQRMLIEQESPEELGYATIRNNLSESSVADRSFTDIGVDLSGLELYYGEHRGEPELRELIASQGDPGVSGEDVLVTAGAAGALFIIATTLLDPDSHLVVVRPNYATNIETPRSIGCDITYVDLSFEEDFRTPIERIERAIEPNTAYISVTCPHNPTGTMVPWEDLLALDALAERSGCLLLVDETYRDLSYGTPYPTAASISHRVIAVSSLSKAYGTPGLRLGWLIVRDGSLFERFLAAKEQMGICTGILDETVGLAVLAQRDVWLREKHPINLARREIVAQWVQEDPRIEWVEPAGGVVCFPRIVPAEGFDADRFYRSLLERHGTYVGPGRWFEMPDHYLRVGFAWPTEVQLHEGLAGISAALREQV